MMTNAGGTQRNAWTINGPENIILSFRFFSQKYSLSIKVLTCAVFIQTSVNFVPNTWGLTLQKFPLM